MTVWIVETLIATSLLMLLVLLVRAPVARWFGASAAYLLWAAPAVRMVLPPIPQAQPLPAAEAVNSVTLVLAEATSPAAAASVQHGGSAAWPVALLAIWLGGAALFMAWHAAAYWRFARRTADGARHLDREGDIWIAASRDVASPVALGILGRTVLLPEDFAHRFDATERRLALAHELAHHSRRDLAANLFALAVLSLHWFNPLAHFAYRAFRLDQEAACDSTVLAGASGDERLAYGTALLKAAAGPVPLAACAMATHSQLKTRLRHIAGAGARRPAVLGSVLAALIVAGGLAATASASNEAKQAAGKNADTPVLALGGVWIDPAEIAEQRRAKDEQAQEESASAAEAAEAAREAAIEARAEAIEAQREARAEALEARREAHRAAREAMESVGWDAPASPAAPAPPAVPSVPSAPAAPAAPDVQAWHNAASCDNGKAMHVHVFREGEGNPANRKVVMVMCGEKSVLYDPAETRKQIRAALEEARDDIAKDENLSRRQKERILRSIERQLRGFSVSLAYKRYPLA